MFAVHEGGNDVSEAQDVHFEEERNVQNRVTDRHTSYHLIADLIGYWQATFTQ